MKNCKSYVIYFGLFVLAVLLVVSTLFLAYTHQQRLQAQLRSEYYKSFLAQAPCVAGVCPGFEGRDMVIKLLANSETLGQIRQSPIYNGSPSIGFSFANTGAAPQGGGHVTFTTNSLDQYEIVEKINLTLGYLTLATTLDALGEPDEFLFVAACGGKGRRVLAKLFYINQGVDVEVEYATRWPTSQVLTGDTQVAWIQYFSPDKYQKHIVESLNWSIVDNTIAYTLPASMTASDLLTQIRPWAGFGVQPTVNLCPR